MSVKGKTVKHCHGKDKGKTISKHKTHKAAVKKHKAIMAKKRNKR